MFKHFFSQPLFVCIFCIKVLESSAEKVKEALINS